MKTVNIHDAKTHFSRLLDDVERGEPLIIARAGKPVARMTRIDAPEGARVRRLGFLRGELQIPDDFDRMGANEIESWFGQGDASSA